MIKEQENEEIDHAVQYVLESEVEECQAMLDCDDAISQFKGMIPKTQSPVIPETQGAGNTQSIPETHIVNADVIAIDDWIKACPL